MWEIVIKHHLGSRGAPTPSWRIRGCGCALWGAAPAVSSYFSSGMHLWGAVVARFVIMKKIKRGREKTDRENVLLGLQQIERERRVMILQREKDSCGCST